MSLSLPLYCTFFPAACRRFQLGRRQGARFCPRGAPPDSAAAACAAAQRGFKLKLCWCHVAACSALHKVSPPIVNCCRKLKRLGIVRWALGGWATACRNIAAAVALHGCSHLQWYRTTIGCRIVERCRKWWRWDFKGHSSCFCHQWRHNNQERGSKGAAGKQRQAPVRPGSGATGH